MKLIEISAWNDSGGGFLHRLFDGHPQLDVWPFELLLGNHTLEPDRLSPDWFRGRFRWPRLKNLHNSSGSALFDQISDAELKPVLDDPTGARHHDYALPVSLAAWRDKVETAWAASEQREQRDLLGIYIESFLALYAPQRIQGQAVLGHCPTIILDASELWQDFPDAQLIHVVRSPLAGFADMSRRHPGLSAGQYANKWVLINTLAATLAAKYPRLVRLVSLDQMVDDRRRTLADICQWLGIDFDEVLLTPSWRGRQIDADRMGPFGGVPQVRSGRDQSLASTLDPADAGLLSEVTLGARRLLREFSDGEVTI